MNSPENWITKLNYSNRAKGLLAIGVFFVISMETDLAVRGFKNIPPTIPNVPYNIKHTALDVVSMGGFASLAQIFFGSTPLESASYAFIGGSAGEIADYAKQHIFKTTDSGFAEIDFLAYFLGSLAWLGFDYSAKLLHDSGLTIPIYRLLGISHRKFDKIAK